MLYLTGAIGIVVGSCARQFKRLVAIVSIKIGIQHDGWSDLKGSVKGEFSKNKHKLVMTMDNIKKMVEKLWRKKFFPITSLIWELT